MDNNDKKFQYTYSVKEQEELRRIREKYTEKEESDLDRLRRLDKSASNKAQSTAITVGIIGALILGFGMSLAMTDIGAVIGLAESIAMLVGIAVGFVSGALIALAHPIYTRVLKSKRQRIAPEILRLTDELMK